MSTREDRYYTIRARTPGAEQNGAFFQTGQGGRTLLPPIDSAFPISHFPVPAPNQYSQQQQRRYDYNQPYSNHQQWQQSSHTSMATPQPAYNYYDETRYSTQQPAAYGMYVQRPSTATPGHHETTRKLPPLSTNPSPGRDDRWGSAYGTQGYGSAQPNHIRSPTASYPVQYNAPGYSATAASSAYPYHVSDPRCVPALNPQLGPSDHRTGSPYGRHAPPQAPATPPPVSPVSSDEPTIKKKRKRADAQQLKVLNDTYARTAFPSTEERLRLAKQLDMSPRSVQIWFQNKRQSMRQTNRQSSTPHQTFSMPSDEQLLDEMESPTSQLPASSHRRIRSQEDVMDARKWSSRGF
ncbi:Homeobox domain-containing protein [Mycena kentingensis (nom. inval.)]|nr:Homeobox domain-containing protein [Mycena kentingensis (nom. inval.)]